MSALPWFRHARVVPRRRRLDSSAATRRLSPAAGPGESERVASEVGDQLDFGAAPPYMSGASPKSVLRGGPSGARCSHMS